VLEEVERYQQKTYSAAHTAMIVEAPALLSAINKNQLIVFMIANPMTGILNLTIRTIYVVEWWNALGWVMGYMLAVSSVAWLLSKYRIKL
jgi:phosphatidylinositol glycan class W